MSNWIKFDKDDKTTWPEIEEIVIVTYHTGEVSTERLAGDFWHYCMASSDSNVVTHWQPLPEPPKD